MTDVAVVLPRLAASVARRRPTGIDLIDETLKRSAPARPAAFSTVSNTSASPSVPHWLPHDRHPHHQEHTMSATIDLVTDDAAVASIAQRVFTVLDRPPDATDDREALVRALPLTATGHAGPELRHIRSAAGLDPTEALSLWLYLGTS